MALSSDSPVLGWIGWIALLPLFQAIRVLSPVTAGVAGAFWGVCLFTAAWGFGNASLGSNVWGIAPLTLIPGLYAALGAGLTRRIGFSPYLLALGWIGVEFALHPLGLRNGLLPAAVEDGFALRLVGSFTGYVLVAFLVAYVNAALFSVLSDIRWGGGSARFARGRSGTFCSHSFHDTFVPPRAFLRLVQPRGPPLHPLAITIGL